MYEVSHPIISTAGVHDISFKTYLGKGLLPRPALSASMIRTMLDKSPLHAANEHPDIGGKGTDDPTKSSGIGTIAHAIILKQDDVRIAVSPHAEFRTNEAKAWRDQHLEKGMIVVKEPDYDAARKMAEAFPERMKRFEKELGESFPKENFEKTVVAELEGVWCKIRIDALGESIWSLKSTGADFNPIKWVKNQYFGMRYDVSVAFYKRVYEAATGAQKRYIEAVIEQEDPFDAYPIILGDKGLERANEQVSWALRTWREGLETGKWQGYAQGRVVHAVPPPWELTEWEDFKAREEMIAQITQREAA